MSQSNIEFFTNDKIDKERWDECINASSQRLIYGLSFYLDRMAAGWNALVGNNYEWVLPLVHRKKFGIAYLYQPPFTQQLGIFAKENADVPFKEIIESLQAKYKFWEVNWNYTTDVNLLPSNVQHTAATNFNLDLKNGYEAIATDYHTDLIKNLKRSRQSDAMYQATGDFRNLIALYMDQYQERMPHLEENDYSNFSALCQHAFRNNMLVCREVVSDKGELLSAVLILNDGRRLYNMMNTTTAAGRKAGANHFLLDCIIREFAGKDFIFDFEGSDLPGVRSFYENFGAINQPFFSLKYNSLPWYVKWLKK